MFDNMVFGGWQLFVVITGIAGLVWLWDVAVGETQTEAKARASARAEAEARAAPPPRIQPSDVRPEVDTEGSE